ncbi:response regulator [Geomesophilobacter sediminis]|uniref:Response regulator n=1 Tax=Geomesophilobacter sediminis TaxID=2798584 RepID=A0A8J7M1U0_9BACT|nr:response regulator [Geomesophilobacter sediminis]MBJ6727133.1 response regulator [Geomesophilobacter sediminis]
MQSKKKVLVIDDEEMHLYTAKGLLESDRIEVVTYRGSFGATNAVRAARPDLILLDVNMPALSGENLVSLLKPLCSELGTPIIFYSSNDETSLQELVRDHEVQGYVCKGDVIGLQGRVNDILFSRQLTSAA